MAMMHEEAQEAPSGAVMLAFLGGVALGAGAALLLAPQSGRESRERLRRLAERAGEASQRAAERGREFTRQASERAGELSQRAAEKGREYVARAGQTAQEAIEQGRQFAQQASRAEPEDAGG